MAFSTMLKKLREERHLSQQDIADYLGVTRQAIAAYELAKREPDYDILRKLGDYFGVSIDYVLGRSGCRDVNALTVGKNIDLIRGTLSYKTLSEEISNWTGVLILPDMLELYAKGERMPFIGTTKIIARYAGVHDSFFFTPNTLETYEKEKELYKIEVEQAESNDNITSTFLGFMDDELKLWVAKESNMRYIKLAKNIQEAGLSADALKPLIDNVKKNKKT